MRNVPVLVEYKVTVPTVRVQAIDPQTGIPTKVERTDGSVLATVTNMITGKVLYDGPSIEGVLRALHPNHYVEEIIYR